MTSQRDRQRQEQREADRAARARDRRLRNAALRLFAEMAEADETISGITMIQPAGEMEYVSADALRRGGRA